MCFQPRPQTCKGLGERLLCVEGSSGITRQALVRSVLAHSSRHGQVEKPLSALRRMAAFRANISHRDQP